jgi:hypothetical protein
MICLGFFDALARTTYCWHSFLNLLFTTIVMQQVCLLTCSKLLFMSGTMLLAGRHPMHCLHDKYLQRKLTSNLLAVPQFCFGLCPQAARDMAAWQSPSSPLAGRCDVHYKQVTGCAYSGILDWPCPKPFLPYICYPCIFLRICRLALCSQYL